LPPRRAAATALKTGIATVEASFPHTAIFEFLKPENPKFPETPARRTFPFAASFPTGENQKFSRSLLRRSRFNVKIKTLDAFRSLDFASFPHFRLFTSNPLFPVASFSQERSRCR